MTHDSYKAWLDEMPIDDVRRRIERLEQKIADLRVLERLHAERHGGGEAEADGSAGEGEVPLLGEAEPAEGIGEEHQHHEASEQG
jgi:hypothetical protein